MATITTRSGKGSPLTNNEVDANFTNLNTDKAELSGATFTGQIVAPSLDISGNIDVDGTTNLDVVDIDGAVDMASTLAVGGLLSANASINVTGNVDINNGYLDIGPSSGNIGKVGFDSNNVFIGSSSGVGQIIFKNNIGSGDAPHSSGDTLLTIADGGAATFTGAITANAGVVIADDSDPTLLIRTSTADQANSGRVSFREASGGTTGVDLKYNGATNTFSIDTTDVANALTVTRTTGAVTINEGGVDADFRVESDGNDHMLFVDGGNDRITIGGNDGTGSLHVKNKDNSGADVHVVVQNTTANRIAGYKIQDESGNTGINLLYDNGGNTATLESPIGDLTLDVAGDINLDADGGEVFFKDGGTSTGKIRMNDGDLQIRSLISDKDITLEGNDNGTIFEAMRLDMSAAGAATFNSTVTSTAFGSQLATTSFVQNAITTTVGSSSGAFIRMAVSNAGNPTYAFDGDTDTGMFTSGSNTLNFSTASTERFKIASDGSLSTPTAGTSNVRFGVNAGNSIASGGNYNTVVGDEAGTAITTGDENALIGYRTGDALNTGGKNTAVGMDALSADTKGSRSVAIGRAALANQNFTSATDSFNTAVGERAGVEVTTGVQNTLIGGRAGDALTDADYNTAIGFQTLSTDTLGSRSTAVGFEALRTQNFTSATNSYNTALGFQAGALVTTGVQNTFVGGLSGDALTDADFNTAIGVNTLGQETLGSRSTAIGYSALFTQNNTSETDANNTAVGYVAGYNITTGNHNTVIGNNSGSTITTGSKNTILGAYSGNQGGLDIRTASNNIVLSDGDGNPRGIFDSSGNLLVGTVAVDPAGNNTAGMSVGTGGGLNVQGTNTALTVGVSSAQTYGMAFRYQGNLAGRIGIEANNITVDDVSDYRLKENVAPLSDALTKIKALKPSSYNFINDPDKAHQGFIAHELQEVIPYAVSGEKDALITEATKDRGTVGEIDPQAVDLRKLVPTLVAAIQEQQALIESLTARIETLEG